MRLFRPGPGATSADWEVLSTRHPPYGPTRLSRKRQGGGGWGEGGRGGRGEEGRDRLTGRSWLDDKFHRLASSSSTLASHRQPGQIACSNTPPYTWPSQSGSHTHTIKHKMKHTFAPHHRLYSIQKENHTDSFTEFLRSRYLVLRVTGIPDKKAKISLLA